MSRNTIFSYFQASHSLLIKINNSSAKSSKSTLKGKTIDRFSNLAFLKFDLPWELGIRWDIIFLLQENLILWLNFLCYWLFMIVFHLLTIDKCPWGLPWRVFEFQGEISTFGCFCHIFCFARNLSLISTMVRNGLELKNNCLQNKHLERLKIIVLAEKV